MPNLKECWIIFCRKKLLANARHCHSLRNVWNYIVKFAKVARVYEGPETVLKKRYILKREWWATKTWYAWSLIKWQFIAAKNQCRDNESEIFWWKCAKWNIARSTSLDGCVETFHSRYPFILSNYEVAVVLSDRNPTCRGLDVKKLETDLHVSRILRSQCEIQ